MFLIQPQDREIGYVETCPMTSICDLGGSQNRIFW